MSVIGTFAAKVGLRERRIGERVPTRGIEAFYSVGGEQKPAAIKDISPSGICLAMDDAPPLGSGINLTLRRKVLEDAEFGTRVSMPARVVRVGRRVVGLEFVHEHINAAKWSTLVLKAAVLSTRNDGVRVFRIARVLAFLQHISTAAEEQFLKDIAGGMSYDGEERALEILLRAEELLLSRRQTPKTGVDAELVLSIIDHGVNLDTSESDMAQCWAGLLASSSLGGADSRESQRFVELLAKLELVPIRILTASCVMAMAVGWDAGYVFPRSIQCNAEEMRKMVGVRGMMAVDRGLDRLYELGLLRQLVRASTFEQVRQVDVTPTALGLRLYARYTGLLELPQGRVAGAGTAA